MITRRDTIAGGRHPGLDPGWLDAVIDPLDTRTWISMGIEAASQPRA
jgi:acetyl-CoA carboxylase carboxyltransferase component